LGKKYSIQRGHISEVLQLEQELEQEPESASVQEPELVPSQGQGLELGPSQEQGQVLEPGEELAPAQGQRLRRELGPAPSPVQAQE
jgi:hypothetical protein